MAIFTRLETDLCKRTLENLDFIEAAQKEGKKVYEATQLFNSLLGIIVNVKESKTKEGRINLFTALYNITIDEEIKEKWKIPIEYKEGSVGDLIYKMRNSIAHIDIKFVGNGTADIESIKFYLDKYDKTQYLVFPIKDLNIFIRNLCEYVKEHGEMNP